jgi:hypothetical protein
MHIRQGPHSVPVSLEFARAVAESGCTLAELVPFTESECRERLRSHWAALEFPDSKHWLEFSSGGTPLYIAEFRNEPPTENLDFPIHHFPELKEFLTFFGGMLDFGRFATPAELLVMRREEGGIGWGSVGQWDGSLIIYQLVSGDALVIHPDGSVGKWLHEYAFMSLEWLENEGLEEAVLDLKLDFTQLLGTYLEYCQLPDKSTCSPNIFFS